MCPLELFVLKRHFTKYAPAGVHHFKTNFKRVTGACSVLPEGSPGLAILPGEALLNIYMYLYISLGF